ncbi:SDR family NAD(P)-dependent oxidoreductase [Rhodococcus chondri]|uniref:SDR family NAD(P)-dependent oxidoreductase n=1 Tax=Rhodococcus chondri TaxID=3065941 RepID=A0ABU7JVS3_9NOCA|nr:SDR family NAD(P)-dependent oxidoreductase [Rhodococcus sp. CC-R104]MEE2033387.1 SDR family NAD(P)-dependent oxidoreductase [Rhodococcus sp. CC-R104]
MKNLNGKIALVTGASGGIGTVLAKALAAQGMDVAVSGRREDVLEQLAQELRGMGVRAAAVPADLGDFGRIDSLVEQTENELGPIDLLINNAGIENAASFGRRTREELTAMVDLNLTAPMLLTHRILPGMLTRGAGHVVFISSLAGKRGIGYQEPYSATKAGLVALVQSLRAEYSAAPVGFSVVCPGFVAGEGMFQRYLDNGMRAPRLVGNTTTDRVAAKVVAAIERDLPEVHVNSVPLRPVLALAEVAPRFVERLAPLFGVEKFFRQASADSGLLDPVVED